MERVGEILASFRRRAYLIRGPHAGASVPIPQSDEQPWPLTVCVGLAGAGQHYVHEDLMPGTYVWSGTCEAHECQLTHDRG